MKTGKKSGVWRSCLVLIVLIYCTVWPNQKTQAADFDPFANPSDKKTAPDNFTDPGPVIPEVQLVNDNITMAFQIISDATGWSIFPTKEVAGAQVTLWAKSITAREFLDKVVKLSGFVYHQRDNIISVMTYDEYCRYHGLEKKVVTLSYAQADSVATVIKPFMTKLGKCVVHKQTNKIVLYEAQANLNLIIKVIEKLDTPSEDILVKVIDLAYVSSTNLAKVLQSAFDMEQKRNSNKSKSTVATAEKTDKGKIKKSSESIQTGIYNPIGIFPVTHTNQLVVVGTEADIEKVRSIISLIDVRGDNMMLEVLDLKYADAQMVAQTLQEVFGAGGKKENSQSPQKNIPDPALKKRITDTGIDIEGVLSAPETEAQVYAIGRTNQLIVKAFKWDIEKVKELVAKLDVFIEPTTKSYHFIYVDAGEIHKGLENILDIYSRYGSSGRSTSQARPTGTTAYQRDSGITLVERTNSILLTAPPSSHRIMSSIKKSIDRPGTYEAGLIRVYKIENANVDEVAATVKEIIETQQREETRPGEPKFKEEKETAPPKEAPEMSETEKFVPNIETKVSVNKATNSLVVLATLRQHRELEKLIKKLDVRRQQVLIKAMIIEVTTNDDADLGVELDYSGQDVLTFTSFGLSEIDTQTGERNVLVSPGGTAAVLRPGRMQSILKALQTTDNIRIQSAPRILVNDNAIGAIQSIAEEPTRQTLQGETSTETSFGEYVKAGTQFSITPHISQSNYLHVEYAITLNSFGEKADPVLPPTRSTSNIQSQATVPDGFTIVVGGIQSSNETRSVDKVPLLGDIPLIGLAFRNTVIRKQYITTYLFITPKIMKNRDFSDLKNASVKALQEVEENKKESSNKENKHSPAKRPPHIKNGDNSGEF